MPRSGSNGRHIQPRRHADDRLGPGAIAAAQAVDEFVPLDQLVRAAQVLAVVAMRFCGVEPD
jgi:acetylornithine deacetylase/succinyl-diaminopimelate desuccinylase-like protein